MLREHLVLVDGLLVEARHGLEPAAQCVRRLGRPRVNEDFDTQATSSIGLDHVLHEAICCHGRHAGHVVGTTRARAGLAVQVEL